MSAYDEGFRARLAGTYPEDCPYKDRSKEKRDWMAGWEDQDQHLRDRDYALASIGW